MPLNLPCPNCGGDGRVANTPNRERWSYWQASVADPGGLCVRMGLVKPVTCPLCLGLGITL